MLRVGTAEVVAQRNPQVALAVERQPGADISPAGKHRLLAKDLAHVLQPPVVGAELGEAHYRTGAVFLLTGIAEIETTALCKIGRQHHIQQSALPLCPYRRHAANRLRQSATGLPEPQLAAAFGNQHALISGQESQRPGMIESVLQLFNADLGSQRGK